MDGEAPSAPAAGPAAPAPATASAPAAAPSIPAPPTENPAARTPQAVCVLAATFVAGGLAGTMLLSAVAYVAADRVNQSPPAWGPELVPASVTGLALSFVGGALVCAGMRAWRCGWRAAWASLVPLGLAFGGAVAGLAVGALGAGGVWWLTAVSRGGSSHWWFSAEEAVECAVASGMPWMGWLAGALASVAAPLAPVAGWTVSAVRWLAVLSGASVVFVGSTSTGLARLSYPFGASPMEYASFRMGTLLAATGWMVMLAGGLWLWARARRRSDRLWWPGVAAAVGVCWAALGSTAMLVESIRFARAAAAQSYGVDARVGALAFFTARHIAGILPIPFVLGAAAVVTAWHARRRGAPMEPA